LLAEAVGGDEQSDEDPGFEGLVGAFLGLGDCHSFTIIVITTIVKRKVSEVTDGRG